MSAVDGSATCLAECASLHFLVGWEAKQIQGSDPRLHLHLFPPPRVPEQSLYLLEVMGTAAQQSQALSAIQDTKCSTIPVWGPPAFS